MPDIPWANLTWIVLNLITMGATAWTAQSVDRWQAENRDARAKLLAHEQGSALDLMLARNITSARAFARLYRAIALLTGMVMLFALIAPTVLVVAGYVLLGTTCHTLIWCSLALDEQRDRRRLDAVARQAARERARARAQETQ